MVVIFVNVVHFRGKNMNKHYFFIVGYKATQNQAVSESLPSILLDIETSFCKKVLLIVNYFKFLL